MLPRPLIKSTERQISCLYLSAYVYIVTLYSKDYFFKVERTKMFGENSI